MHKLGFGMMRLPLLDPKQTSQIDVPQVSAMADAFLAQGFTGGQDAPFPVQGRGHRRGPGEALPGAAGEVRRGLL